MFTGIIEAIGVVSAIEPAGALIRLSIEAPAIADAVCVGDSISVNGACLTVTEHGAGRCHFEAVRETLDRTALGGLIPGGRVNLERALRADARLDGHIVQGHVDGTGRVSKLSRAGEDVRLYIECGRDVSDTLVEKGSVAIDGVSLTVAGVSEAGFDVALIPHTLEVTTLGELTEGALVNLESDVLGKYVKKFLARTLPAKQQGI